MDKAMFFLILGLACIWLVLDQFFGNKYIENFTKNVIG